MRAELFDSSIYISALRRGDDATLSHTCSADDAPIWLSSVVLSELYAGATDNNRHAVEGLERDFAKIGRIVVPNFRDWTQTGHVLARVAAKYGYKQIGRGRLTDDALIAISAGRLGIEIIATNRKDFIRLAEFQSFHWRVAVM